MNIIEKFLELTQYTEVLYDEHLIRKYLPEELNEDSIGNYWLKIGESDTMFASHLDTAAFMREKVTHVFDEIKTKRGTIERFVETDGTTLLGADDRTGVVIMMYMIEHKIPGLYYFFIGEESGTVGSTAALNNYPEIFEEYNRCISFDRRGYGSIITQQMGGKCCSPKFTNQLAKELTQHTGYKHEGDPTGIYTDSAIFMDDIPECTNISVGYFNEHSVSEFQNLTYLEDLCEGVLKVKWDELPVERKCGPLDTPNPKREPKKDGDLSDKELAIIFHMVEDIFEETQLKDCVNRINFIPEKEMLFVHFRNVDDIVSVWIHEDGSILIDKDLFDDIIALEDKVEEVYGYRSGQDEDEDEDEDGNFSPFKDDVDLSDDSFSKDVDIIGFIDDVSEMELDHITPGKINDLLSKYNKTIESLIIWIYSNGNNPAATRGLTWDEVDNQFDFDDTYIVKNTGHDSGGARTF